MSNECSINISKNVLPDQNINLLLRWEGKDNSLAFVVARKITQYLMKQMPTSLKVLSVTIQVLPCVNSKSVTIIFYKMDTTVCVKSYLTTSQNLGKFLRTLKRHLSVQLLFITE